MSVLDKIEALREKFPRAEQQLADYILANPDHIRDMPSQMLAKALADKGHPHKLVVYPGADHDLNPNRAEADTETAAWLKQYL